MADDDIIRGGFDIVTDKTKKKNKPKAEHDPHTPMGARLMNLRTSKQTQNNFEEETHSFKFAKHVPDDQHPSSRIVFLS